MLSPADPEWLALSGVLERHGGIALRLVAMAFVYDLVPAGQERREVAGGAYAPMWDDGQRSHPPRPADLLEPVRVLWRSILDTVEDPIVQARLAACCTSPSAVPRMPTAATPRPTCSG